MEVIFKKRIQPGAALGKGEKTSCGSQLRLLLKAMNLHRVHADALNRRSRSYIL